MRYTADELETQHGKPLFSYGLLIGVFLAVIVYLIYLFPGNHLIQTLKSQEYISDVNFRYSILLVANEGGNSISYNKINENPTAVIQQLNEMRINSTNDSLWLKYIILKSIFYRPKLSKEVNLQAMKAIRDYLESFKSRPLTVAQDLTLAKDSLAIDNAQLALYFSEQVLSKNPQQGVDFYAKLGQIALWAKQCVRSADYYFKAQQQSKLLNDKRYFYVSALKILFQCNEFDRAIQSAAKYLDGLSEDEQTYQLLVDLAIKANKPALAQHFVLKLMQLKEESQTK